MAVNKNFVVKNGLEVAADALVVSVENKNVGIGTTIAQVLLDVKGAIGATHISVSGVGTIVTLNSTNFTNTNGNITNLSGTIGTITTFEATNGTITNLSGTNGNITNLSGTIGTITTFEATNSTITNLSGTISTIGNVRISTGIVTATIGIVTYYGDGQYLDNVVSGVGIKSEGSLVGYGVTLFDFVGSGVSSIVFDSNVGISTIHIAGGGGGGGANTQIIKDVFNVTGVTTTFTLSDTYTTGYLDVYLNGVKLSSSDYSEASSTTIDLGSPAINGDILEINNYKTISVASVVYATSSGIADYADTAGIATYSSTAGIATYATSSGIATYADTTGIATALLGGNAGVNTTTTPTNLYVYGNAASNVVGLGTTDANTTLDFSIGNNFSLTLTGSIVLLNPTGITTGQSGIVLIYQDGTGSRTCGFGSHWDFPSSTPPTLSTGANALDCITYFVNSSTSIVANSLIGIGTL